MSGKLILEKEEGWKQVLPALALSVAATVLVVLLLVIRIPLEGMAQKIVVALLTYLIFRVFYRTACQLLPGRETTRTLTWTLTEDALTLGGTVIPRESIRQVHCWPNRDALGHERTGWTVNIETTGKNQVLRSVTEGPGVDISARQLRELVAALGYGDRWKEPEREAPAETEE